MSADACIMCKTDLDDVQLGEKFYFGNITAHYFCLVRYDLNNTTKIVFMYTSKVIKVMLAALFLF